MNASFSLRSSTIGDKRDYSKFVKEILSTQNNSNISKQSLNLLPVSINLSNRVDFTAYNAYLIIINASDLDVKKSLLEIYSCYACINSGL